jgi:hypothetical protein
MPSRAIGQRASNGDSRIIDMNPQSIPKVLLPSAGTVLPVANLLG